MDSLECATCNFTAVENMAYQLRQAGFSQLDPRDAWTLTPGGKYYVVKNSSAIFAFTVGFGKFAEVGMRIISAHSDSPGFKLKPNCEIYGDGGMVTLNVEKYGGPIMYTWFDRPLSLAGRVMLRGNDPMNPIERIVDLNLPIATIPHLAIHFNREVNEGNKLSVQKDMLPVIGYYSEEQIAKYKKTGGVVKNLLAEHLDVNTEDIIDYELQLYPCETTWLVGAESQFIQSGRIDDLSMAYAALEALISEADAGTESTRIVAIFDNEETGSGTKQGAHSPVLLHIIERIAMCLNASPEDLLRAQARSFMISADDAHAWHPNYNTKYDPTNHPVMGGGPVVKINANCKYMTDAKGAAVFRELCRKAGVNVQYFVNHSDIAGGSTLGNISSAQLDIDGVDVGCAIWAMHSAAETASVSDHLDMVAVFREFFKN